MCQWAMNFVMPAPAPTAAAAEMSQKDDTLRRSSLVRFLRWLGADRELAADLAHEAMLRLLQAPPDAKDEATVASWLRRVARNLFISARTRAREGVPLDDIALLDAAWRKFTAEDRDAGDARLRALESCLGTLSDRTRQALALHYRHGLTHEELASALGMRVAGTRRLLERARLALATCIAAGVDAEQRKEERS